jgi:hypothetical protein
MEATQFFSAADSKGSEAAVQLAMRNFRLKFKKNVDESQFGFRPECWTCISEFTLLRARR